VELELQGGRADHAGTVTDNDSSSSGSSSGGCSNSSNISRAYIASASRDTTLAWAAAISSACL
jgi:hypothetical protein